MLSSTSTMRSSCRRVSPTLVSQHSCQLRCLSATNTTSSSSSTSKSSAASHIKHLGVIGAGQMGTGIAYVAAINAGLNVTILDNSSQQLEKATKFIKSLMEKDIKKGKLDASTSVDEILSRIHTTTSYDKLDATQFIIEAAAEKLNIKQAIFKQLSEVTKEGVILASNTSSISITKIAASTATPQRAADVIGMHFMNPVPVMKLVETITALQTSEKTLAVTMGLGERMGKTMTHSADIPGFIANRLLMPYINEAIYTLQENIASRDDIDTTMKLGCNMPMGPLILADFIGLDTCLSIMQVLQSGLGDSKYRAAPLLQQYVDAGWLGKKSGRGFYDYSSGQPK